MIELIKTLVVYVGGLAIIAACLIIAWAAWASPAIEGRDLAALLGVLGVVIGQATQFLWTQAAATATAANAERAAAAMRQSTPR